MTEHDKKILEDILMPASQQIKENRFVEADSPAVCTGSCGGECGGRLN
jgi:hypothetical protein